MTTSVSIIRARARCVAVVVGKRLLDEEGVDRRCRENNLRWAEWVAGNVDLTQVALAGDAISMECDLARIPSVGVSSLDLGRLARRPFFFESQHEATKNNLGNGSSTVPSGRVG